MNYLADINVEYSNCIEGYSAKQTEHWYESQELGIAMSHCNDLHHLTSGQLHVKLGGFLL